MNPAAVPLPRRMAISARGLTRAFSGPNAVISGLIRGFVKYAPEIELHVYYDDPQALDLHPGVRAHLIPNTFRLVWDHLLLPRALKRDAVDLALLPKGTIPLRTPCPTMTLMHDLGYFYPRLRAYRRLETLYMKHAMRYAARRVEHIFVVSESTRRDVIRFLKAEPERVTTVYNAPVEGLFAPVEDAAQREEVVRRYALQQPFIFYPTSISPRKNVERLLDAFVSLGDTLPHHLYLTGGRKWRATRTLAQVEAFLGRRVHLLGDVPAEDMPVLYSLAEFTVYPSLFEGFGLPIVEAFLCGSPVMASDTTSIPEVAGEAALLVDPYRVEALREGLLRMARDAALRAALRERGFEQAQRFTWERTIGRYKEVLAAVWKAGAARRRARP